jgi:hypothetical protein
MGIRIATWHEPEGACLYDGTTEMVFGPVIHNPDHAEPFLAYFVQRAGDGCGGSSHSAARRLFDDFLELLEEADEVVVLTVHRFSRGACIGTDHVIGVKCSLTPEQIAEAEEDGEDADSVAGFARIKADGRPADDDVEVVEAWNLETVEP